MPTEAIPTASQQRRPARAALTLVRSNRAVGPRLACQRARSCAKPSAARHVARIAADLTLQLAIRARIALLAIWLWDLNRYLDECAEDGLDNSLSITEFHRQRDDLEGKLIILRAGEWA